MRNQAAGMVCSSDRTPALELPAERAYRTAKPDSMRAGRPVATESPNFVSRSRKNRTGAPALFTRWLQVCRALLPFGRRHARSFACGVLAALLVVGIRLVLPWPLKALMAPWLGKTSHHSAGLLQLVPSWIDPTVAMGALFLVLLLSLGLADYIERLYFARFAIGSIRDLRAEAFRKMSQTGQKSRELGSGDVVARLIGDTARIKAGLKGFLVHVATNGVMFLGVSVVLLWISLALGLIFTAAGVLVVVATTWGARAMYRRALKFRTKEGRLADFIQEAWDDELSAGAFGDVNESSGKHEAALTGVQGVTTWAAHIILGAAIVAALWVGAQSVAADRVAAGDFMVVMMYALMIRAPIVQLTRQGARTGKIMACGDRLERLLSSAPDSQQGEVRPLRDQINIEGARVVTRRAGTTVRRLGPIDLCIPAGQRVAVLGKPGSGKTTLLELMAGTQPLKAGRISWDGRDLSTDEVTTTLDDIAFLPHNPTWPRRRIGELLDAGHGEVDVDTRKLLRTCGANSLLKRLPNGLDTKLASTDLSPRERVAVALASLARSKASLWLLDDPVGALEKRMAQGLIKRILNAKTGDTVIVTLSRPVRLGKFDRVIVLKRGTMAFDGTAEEWRVASKERAKPKQEKHEEPAPMGGQRGEKP